MTNVFGNDQTFTAEVRSPVDATITVAGRDVSPAVQSFTYRAGIREVPRAELDLACWDATRISSEHTEVAMNPATRELLVDAGWWPPEKHTPNGQSALDVLDQVAFVLETATDDSLRDGLRSLLRQTGFGAEGRRLADTTQDKE